MMNRFYTLEEINPKLKLLSDRRAQIHREFLEAKDKFVWTNWSGATGYHGYNQEAYRGWQIAALYGELKASAELSIADMIQNFHLFEKNYQQKLYPDLERQIVLCNNAKYMPTLVRTLYECGVTKRVAISVVYPGKDIKWHVDPDPELENKAIIRGLWGLDIRPQGDQSSYLCLGTKEEYETKYFKNNEFMFFWGRILHKVENSLQTPRYVVCFDQDVDKDYLQSLGD